MEGSVEIIDGMRPFLFYFALVIFVVLTMLVLSHFLGERVDRPGKNLPFESGIVSVGSTHFRISVQFYMPAILFIIFDLEAAFLFPWAVHFRQLGFFALVEMVIFVAILVVGWLYAWRKKALEWG